MFRYFLVGLNPRPLELPLGFDSGRHVRMKNLETRCLGSELKQSRETKIYFRKHLKLFLFTLFILLLHQWIHHNHFAFHLLALSSNTLKTHHHCHICLCADINWLTCKTYKKTVINRRALGHVLCRLPHHNLTKPLLASATDAQSTNRPLLVSIGLKHFAIDRHNNNFTNCFQTLHRIKKGNGATILNC